MIEIPLVDLRAQHEQVADEVADGWAEVLKTTAFINGPQVARFESEFAAYQEVPHAIGVGNGTDAIELALRALGVGHGRPVRRLRTGAPAQAHGRDGLPPRRARP